MFNARLLTKTTWLKAAATALLLCALLLYPISLEQFGEVNPVSTAAAASTVAAPVTPGPPTYYKDGFVVLTYHHLDTTESAYTITPERFTEQIDTLRRLGYNFVSLETAGQFLQRKAKLPPNAVVVTFDDGLDSFYTKAYPILKQRSIPATMFVVVRYVGQSYFGVRRLSWDEMLAIQGNGFSFHSHTYNSHHKVTVDETGTVLPAISNLTYFGEGRYETQESFHRRVYDDLVTAKNMMEDFLKRPVDFFALPFGSATEKTKTIALEAGYKYILTMKPGINTQATAPTRILRFDAGNPRKSGLSIHKEISAYFPKPPAPKEVAKNPEPKKDIKSKPRPKTVSNKQKVKKKLPPAKQINSKTSQKKKVTMLKPAPVEQTSLLAGVLGGFTLKAGNAK